jgi:PhnB protein
MPIIPYLYYEDVAAARRFLARAFGFKNYGATNRSQDGALIHAAMKLGKDVVMMGDPGAKYRGPRRLGGATQCLLANHPDVDALFARAVRAGATVLQSPADTPFGQRRFGVEDPEGHQWFFAQAVTRKGAKRGRARPASA